MAKENPQNQKLPQSRFGLKEKLSNPGKLLLKAVYPQLGNISNLKIKKSLDKPNDIPDKCIKDLSKISLKFHLISTGEK